jgi:hypothetical protein
MTVSWLTFATVGSLYSFLGSLLEEARVRDAYRDAYDAYRARAPFFAPLPILRGERHGAQDGNDGRRRLTPFGARNRMRPLDETSQVAPAG